MFSCSIPLPGMSRAQAFNLFCRFPCRHHVTSLRPALPSRSLRGLNSYVRNYAVGCNMPLSSRRFTIRREPGNSRQGASLRPTYPKIRMCAQGTARRRCADDYYGSIRRTRRVRGLRQQEGGAHFRPHQVGVERSVSCATTSSSWGFPMRSTDKQFSAVSTAR